MTFIHPSAHVSPKATLGQDVHIGPFSIVHDNVVLGDRVNIGAYCELGISTRLGDGSPLVIGEDALIRSHCIFYESSRIGAKLVTGHRAIVRENSVIGLNFQLGTACEIQGDCTIGDYVRFQSNVFICKKTVIGNFVWVLPNVVLTNDPTPPSDISIGSTIEDFATLAAGALILPGVTIGHHALVAANACVTKDVPPHMLALGSPAKTERQANSILKRDGSEAPAYPWTTHFHRGYPEEITRAWKKSSDAE